MPISRSTGRSQDRRKLSFQKQSIAFQRSWLVRAFDNCIKVQSTLFQLLIVHSVCFLRCLSVQFLCSQICHFFVLLVLCYLFFPCLIPNCVFVLCAIRRFAFFVMLPRSKKKFFTVYLITKTPKNCDENHERKNLAEDENQSKVNITKNKKP